MELENPLPEDSKLLLLIGTLQEKVTQITQEKILETVVQLLQKAFGDKISYIHKVMYRKSFVWLLESEDKELPALLFVSALDIQKMIQLRLGLLMYFGIARESVGWKELCSGYSELWTEMQRQAINEENSIIMESRELYISDSFNGEESDFEQMLTPITEKLRMMEEFLSGENFPAFTDLLQDILSILVKAKRHSLYALEIYYSLGNILIAYINKKNIRPQLASRIQLMELFDPGSFVTWEQAAEYIIRLTSSIQEICMETQQTTMMSITERTKTYCLSHLSEDLSLPVIGQAIGFNPVYLSRIFKQIEGTSIREYIEICRMDLARRLIRSTRMKVYEIAEKCGYQNPAYFIKIFRAHYGMTPQECRDMG